MKAISYSETGPSSVLQLIERDKPTAGPGEVVVRIVVSGVNPTDWKSRAGSGSAAVEPRVPNQDGAGVIDSIGADVEGLTVGQRVWVWDAAYQRTEGTAQEFALLPAERVVPLPDAASFDVGASLGIPALTAHRTLTVSSSGPARLAPGALQGHTVLVAGGAGAVGHAAIQLAVWAGATVITTVSSPEKAALARAAGAQHVIDYTKQDLVEAVRAIAPGGVQNIVEVNPLANFAADLELLAPNGAVALYAADGAAELSIPVRSAMGKNVQVQFVLTYTVTSAQKADAVASVSAAAAAGALAVGADAGLPITRFPLERTADAHDAVQNGAIGKVLIDVTAA